MPPDVERVLLLSPIVGEFANDAREMDFVPPDADQKIGRAIT